MSNGYKFKSGHDDKGEKGPLVGARLSPSGGAGGVNVHQLVGNYDPSNVMSVVQNAKNKDDNPAIKEHFFNLETHKISSLVPELRFFKAEGDKVTPFYFPVAAELREKPFSLGTAIVRNFDVTFDGTDPFTAPRYLKANLTLYVDNIALIFADPPPGYARLAELFTISIARGNKRNVSPSGGASIAPGDLSRPIEVAASLGYTMSNRGNFTEVERQEILESNLALRLNVISHNIDVAQDGSANISVNYTARIGHALKDKIFSFSDSLSDTLARADIRQLFYRGAPDGDKARTMEKMPKTAENLEKKRTEIRKILEIADSHKKIHKLTFSPKEFDAYAARGGTSKATPASPNTPAQPPAVSGSAGQ